MSKKTKPTDSELEILQVLWKYGPSTVKFINEELNKTKRTGYTTTLKIMQIMTGKGYLSRTLEKRSHIYFAVLKEQKTQSVIIDKIVKSAFGGSSSKLVMQLLGNHKPSKDEREEIRKLLDKMEDQQQ